MDTPTANITDLKDLVDLQIQNTHRKGLDGFYTLRYRWSCYIRNLLYTTIGFQMLLIGCIGFGWVDFSDYKTFLHAVVIENFLQILGMGYIIINFLYHKPKE